MNLIPIIFLVVSSTLDDLGVGFSIGMQRRIPVQIILIIALFSGATMAIGIFLGDILYPLIPAGIDDLIAALVFLSFGIYFIFKKTDPDDQKKEPIDLNTYMGIILGITLSINSLVLGVSAGITGYPIIFTSLLAFFLSFIFLLVGSLFGKAVQPILNRADLISGFLLIALAFVTLLTS
ncbi:manganese efflux pump MntP family protein [Natranaerobius trueperi]|uniref:Sporulation membrane protein YtaF n=1 Tax=Natranaerobius trueperi TaxID=759412 RepID=A0A226BV65_9FIRM|nr:manganese efflux pump [Natranaerobius trueperi]OWZ82883.1 hypothetical protein CDO51_11655 [Natranaerobius trueperi]